MKSLKKARSNEFVKRERKEARKNVLYVSLFAHDLKDRVSTCVKCVYTHTVDM
jgi:hypothetical protein